MAYKKFKKLPGNYEGRKRLLKLAVLLEEDAKNKTGLKFDMSTWGETSNDKTDIAPSCGTQACAMGLAAISGKFKRAGLDFKQRLTTNYGPIDTRNYYDLTFTWKGRQLVNGLTVAMELFGITEDQAYYLFIPDSYPDSKKEGAAGERYVAGRIRKLAEGKYDPRYWNGEEEAI